MNNAIHQTELNGSDTGLPAPKRPEPTTPRPGDVPGGLPKPHDPQPSTPKPKPPTPRNPQIKFEYRRVF